MNWESAWDHARIGVGIAAGYVRRNQKQIISSSTGSDPNRGSNRWVVYANYSRQGRVFDYVLYALKALCDEGFRIIFVSNSTNFGASEVATVQPWCAKIIHRRNVGYDFGAYKDGISSIDDFTAIENLILMNDSVYGPLFPISDTIDRMSMRDVDIWGLTDSWQHDYHLQSYFLCFNRNVLVSSFFREFWRKIPLINYKKSVIRGLEIETSQMFLDNGYKLAAAFPYYALTDRFMGRFPLAIDPKTAPFELELAERLRTHFATGSTVNPTHFFWEMLINDFRFPFIKGELISKNPAAIYGINRWYDKITKLTDYDPDMIMDHLKYSQRPRLFGNPPAKATVKLP
ncbi:rhamnan synthesis F family protein [Bosea sp. OK403]|uniref:rhamnan synthesis F family protein n=1 Tax=Bosea sp. OK403 TaxID=1855286 RepID=UPI000B882BD6|nr:rhamnan synthesis F family protein [Bosea sp. OK403]